MFAPARLNAGLLVGRDYELILFESPAVPASGVQVEDAASLGRELRIAWKDPTAVIPGPDRVLMEPAPDRAAGNGGDQARLTDMASDVRRIPMRKGNRQGGR